MLQRLSIFAGSLLVLISLGFVANRLWVERSNLLEWQPDVKSIAIIFFCICAYASSNLILSFNWRKLLNLFGAVDVDSRLLRSIYAKSQIAKYIPGNIAHIAGRHMMGRAIGLNHKVLSLAALYEILGLCVAAMALGVLGLLLFELEGSLQYDFLYFYFFFSIAIVMLFFGYSIAQSQLSNLFHLHKIQPSTFFRVMLILLSNYFGFFMIAGFALLLIVSDFFPLTNFSQSATVLISFALGWTIGFFTPGAPSGIGIREAIIVGILQTIIDPASAVLAALIFRLVTILGDILFLGSVALFDKLEKTELN